MVETVYEGIARIEARGDLGMVAIRGDLSDKPILSAIAKGSGLKAPDPLKLTASGDSALLWMSPDETLLLCPSEDTQDRIAALNAAFGDLHALVTDVSDARACFTVSGAHARDVLAKICPADLSPSRFSVKDVRRTRLGQVAAAIWVEGEGAFQVMCFRSVRDYVAALLQTSARPGSEVNSNAQ